MKPSKAVMTAVRVRNSGNMRTEIDNAGTSNARPIDVFAAETARKTKPLAVTNSAIRRITTLPAPSLETPSRTISAANVPKLFLER